MIATTAQQTLIPSAACLHIRDGDQGLRAHSVNLSIPKPELPIFWRLSWGTGTAENWQKSSQRASGTFSPGLGQPVLTVFESRRLLLFSRFFLASLLSVWG
jgi:hypothetical protein